MRYKNTIFLIRVCEPILRLVDVEELFRFQYEIPVFDLLFQFPPKWASVHPKSLFCSSFYYWGLAAPKPPLRGFLTSREPKSRGADAEELPRFQHESPAGDP